MERRLALTRILVAGAAFALGAATYDPPAELPPIAAQAGGNLPGALHRQLSLAGAGARDAYGARLAATEERLQGELDGLLGLPSRWPDSIAPELEPEAFREEISGPVARSMDRAPRRVDCDNHPCIAWFAEPMAFEDETENEDFFLEAVKARNELRRTWGKDRMVEWNELGIHADPDGTSWMLVGTSLLPTDAPPEQRAQVEARMTLGLLMLKQDLGLLPRNLD